MLGGTKMNYFSIKMNIDFKKVVVVGGGRTAWKKIEALLLTKAIIVVVSPEVNEQIQSEIASDRVLWKQKHFEPADLDDAVLIYATISDESVNEAIEEATQHWQLLHRVDGKGRNDFSELTK